MLTLELDRLGRRFGRTWALRGATMAVEEGEMVAVWGRSGAGKTTMLELLATLRRPSEGRARVDGHDLRLHPSRVRSAVGIGFQIPALDLDRTLFEGLDLRATMMGVPRAHRPSRIFELLALLGLDERKDLPVRALSDSQRRRAEIVAALLPERRVLLLDEPFVAMDPDTTQRVWEHLLSLRTQSRATLLIATSRAEVAGQCHRIAVLHKGRMMACDTPDLVRSAAGKDVVTVRPLDERLTARRLHEKLQVAVSEETDGFSIEVHRGDQVAAEILGEFGGQTSALYVRRPSLDAGLSRLADGTAELPIEEAEAASE